MTKVFPDWSRYDNGDTPGRTVLEKLLETMNERSLHKQGHISALHRALLVRTGDFTPIPLTKCTCQGVKLEGEVF